MKTVRSLFALSLLLSVPCVFAMEGDAGVAANPAPVFTKTRTEKVKDAVSNGVAKVKAVPAATKDALWTNRNKYSKGGILVVAAALVYVAAKKAYNKFTAKQESSEDVVA